MLLYDRVVFPFNIGHLTYSEYLELDQENDLNISQKRFKAEDSDSYSGYTVLSED